MKKFSKIFCVVICIGLINTTLAPIANAELSVTASVSIKYEFEQDLRTIADEYITQNPDHTDIINKEYESYINDEMLSMFYGTSKYEALDTFETALKIAIRNSTQEIIGTYNMTPTGSDSLFYCDVDTTIEQETTTWCGVASTQIALTGIQNCASSNLISGFELPSQSDIAPYVCGTGNSATVGNIRTYLNSMLKTSAYKYTYKEITGSIDSEDIASYIRSSLYINRPVILHAMPYDAFDYYSDTNYSGGHYVVIDRCYLYADMFRVVDPTYLIDSNDDPYQGVHYVTADEIYNSLYCPEDEVTGRYLIYG